MSKRLLLLALLAGCAAPTTSAGVITRDGEDPSFTSVEADPAPTPVWTPRVNRTVPRASRSRTAPADPQSETGSHLSSTAYCETGLMANGDHTYRGAVAGNRWKLGTRVHVTDSPYGPGIFTVTDRIGHGSELDFAMPGDCAGARTWGRRSIRVEVVR